jgi:hypothetical protein
MGFKSSLLRRLKRPVDPLGYICISLFLPLSIIHVRDLWSSQDALRLGSYVSAVVFLLPLWFWTTLKALAEIRWSRYWIIPLCLPVVLLLVAEMTNWRKLVVPMLAIQLVVTVALMFPTPHSNFDKDLEQKRAEPPA